MSDQIPENPTDNEPEEGTIPKNNPKAKIQVNVDRANAGEVAAGSDSDELVQAAKTGKRIKEILNGKEVEGLNEQDIQDAKDFLDGWNKASRGDLDFTKDED